MRNDHFNPHGFAISATASLALASVVAMQSAASAIQERVAERSEAERWDALEEMLEAQVQRFADIRAIMDAQDRTIDEMTATIAKLSARLLAANR